MITKEIKETAKSIIKSEKEVNNLSKKLLSIYPEANKHTIDGSIWKLVTEDKEIIRTKRGHYKYIGKRENGEKIIEQLERLSKLKSDGNLTNEEFISIKRNILL